jgi:hypothetical protein
MRQRVRQDPVVSQMEDFTSSRAFRVAGPTAFNEAGITHQDVDHLMIYDALQCGGDLEPRLLGDRSEVRQSVRR